MTHQHTFYPYGGGLACVCGQHRVDPRSPEQITRDRSAATLRFKIKVNEAMGAPTVNLRAALAALAR